MSDSGQSRKIARMQVVQILFAADSTGRLDGSLDIEDEITKFRDGFDYAESQHDFIAAHLNGIIADIEAIDAKIEATSEHWTMDRMNLADRNILRIATYELFFGKNVPVEVSLNEAIELAKKFGDKKSPKFVNGVLDGMLKSTS